MKKKVLMGLVLLTIAGASMVFAQTDKLTFTVRDGAATVKAKDKGISGNVVIPASYQGNPVLYIASSGFSGCTQIKSVTIPESIKVIPGNAFNGCRALDTVAIHKYIREIGGGAFQNCSSLDKIQNADIGAETRKIGSSAFAGTSLDRVWIRSNVSEIGGSAFNTARMQLVNFEAAGVKFNNTSFPNGKSLQDAYAAGGRGRYKLEGKTWIKE